MTFKGIQKRFRSKGLSGEHIRQSGIHKFCYPIDICEFARQKKTVKYIYI